MSHDVVFRRIGGRVVPIRSSRAPVNDKKPEAAASAAAGAIVSVAAGKKGSQLVRRAANIEAVARKRQAFATAQKQTKQLSMFKIQSADRLFKASDRVHKSRNVALTGGAIAGGALIGHALNLNSKAKTKEDKAKNYARGFAASSVVTNVAYGRFLMPRAPFDKVVDFASKRAKPSVELAKKIIKGISRAKLF